MSKDIYRLIKIAGMVSFIPFIMLSGPLGGYILGSYLSKKFNLPGYITVVIIGAGFLVSLIETIRVIKLVFKLRG